MSDTIKHTKLPWKYYWKFNEDTQEANCGINNYDGWCVCSAPKYQNKTQWTIDAEFITCATNNYYDLIDALEKSNEILKIYEALDGGHEAYCRRVENNKVILKCSQTGGSNES